MSSIIRFARRLSISALMLAALGLVQQVYGQGCVQSRGAAGFLVNGEDVYLPANSWQANVGYRWLYSDRHFVGSREQRERETNGSQVINDSHFIDLTATYAITKRFAVNLTVPFVYSDRSSLYEHDGVNRHHMQAGGLADMRLSTTMWIFDPEKHKDGNISLGVGVKAPTGDAEVTDIAYRATGPVLRYVDQSIQPGDGGWGVTLDVQAFQKVFDRMYGYMNASYLISPKEMVGTTGYSTPDTYLLRAGFSYVIWPAHGLSLSLGPRMEGVPVTDWIGSSQGSRRPGYAISIEPGITWAFKKLAINVTAPVAVAVNRERSVNGRLGDAAFADFIITSSISYRF